MKIRLFCASLLLFGCAKRVNMEPHASTPIISADRTWAYYVDGPSDWTVISKVGPGRAVKEVCPKGAICTTEEVGVMYRVKRIH